MRSSIYLTSCSSQKSMSTSLSPTILCQVSFLSAISLPLPPLSLSPLLCRHLSRTIFLCDNHLPHIPTSYPIPPPPAGFQLTQVCSLALLECTESLGDWQDECMDGDTEHKNKCKAPLPTSSTSAPVDLIDPMTSNYALPPSLSSPVNSRLHQRTLLPIAQSLEQCHAVPCVQPEARAIMRSEQDDEHDLALFFGGMSEIPSLVFYPDSQVFFANDPIIQIV